MSTKTSDPTVELFSAQLRQRKFSAGFLLSGEENDKKKQVATRFAKALNCENKKPSEDCDCTSCKKIDSGNHPDVRWYGLDEEERSMKIETMRELQDWLNLKPYEGRVKVFLLNMAERLTVDAQNALLKSLEEPPPNSVLILMVKKKSDLLETVISRLQEIKVPPFQEEELVKMLVQEKIGKLEATCLARYSAGNLGHARLLHDTGWFEKKNNLIRALLRDVVSGFDTLATKPRKEISEQLTLLSSWIRDACAFKAGSDPVFLIHEDSLSILEAFSKNHSLNEMVELYQQIETIQKALEDNANVKLALATLQVKWRNFCNG